MSARQTLPVLPLRGTVIFPGLTAPIAAGRPGTLRAIESALKGDRLVFAVAQRDNTEEPSADILYSMGVIARIGQGNRTQIVVLRLFRLELISHHKHPHSTGNA